ncbi:Hypothetical predicted protein [Mytilus galloprovincialis]|uniref:B box-type domain-containing protein n=1 Tax=Mytilus galloprovincialis TaxID=29158 RepID=A0A8B6EI19_MYTGA|nr:Hypothetical predicted protein [Mytilus galloprovincialis]
MATHDQIVCGQCSRGDVVSPGSSWCSECEEILCTPCNRIHRLVKVTQYHHLADLHEPSFIQKESFMNIPFCDKHVNKNIDLYCMFHDVVCCRTCVLESHRPCENVQEVEDVSGSIKSSALVEDVSKAVSELSKTFESIIKTRKKNLEAVNCQESVIKESIVKLKADLLKDVDLLEKSLLKDLSNFHEKTISKLDASVNEFSEMNDTWSKIKEELKFNMEYGSNSRIFILAEKIKHKLPETEMKLPDILSKIVNVNIKYCVKKKIYQI